MFSVMTNKDTNENKMIIELGGKQHLAETGDRIVVNQNNSKEGEMVVAKDLLNGNDVNLKVIKNFLGKKINGMKFKSKSRYTRRYGHRQHLMMLEVIGSKKNVSVPKKATAKPKTKKDPIEKKTAKAGIK